MDQDQDDQENEILALESIFEDDDVLTIEKKETLIAGSFCIRPDIENEPLKVVFSHIKRKPSGEADNSQNDGVPDIVYSIEYLPPIFLHFSLPKDYPSKNSPRLNIECKWLNRGQLTMLCKKLDEIWEEQVGQEVLFTWYQFLKENSLKELGLSQEIFINEKDFVSSRRNQNFDFRVVQDVSCFSEISSAISDHNEMQKKRTFDNTPYDCAICFNSRYGRTCLQFRECKHVYCKECITSFFDVQIKEGNVKALTCPDPKCTSQAYPGQIKELVGPEEFSRYETLLLQTTLDTMDDVTYCPRKYCQSPVIVEEDIGICSVCKFSFCPHCKLAYHGLSSCKIKKEKLREMCTTYKNADNKTKREMESKYGTAMLISTLQNIESEEWIMSNAKNCPGCGAAIEKSDGCNKMTCYSTDTKLGIAGASLFHVSSRGSVTMDERGRPVVDFAYLKDPKDLQAMGKAVDNILQVIRKENLQVLIPNFDLNPPDTKAVASMMAAPYYHYAGSCALGKALDANDFTVKGVSNLRVIDASTLPNNVHANTQVPTMIVAHAAANVVLDSL